MTKDYAHLGGCTFTGDTSDTAATRQGQAGCLPQVVVGFRAKVSFDTGPGPCENTGTLFACPSWDDLQGVVLECMEVPP